MCVPCLTCCTVRLTLKHWLRRNDRLSDPRFCGKVKPSRSGSSTVPARKGKFISRLAVGSRACSQLPASRNARLMPVSSTGIECLLPEEPWWLFTVSGSTQRCLRDECSHLGEFLIPVISGSVSLAVHHPPLLHPQTLRSQAGVESLVCLALFKRKMSDPSETPSH